MRRNDHPSAPGDDMATLTNTETARIESLLARLEARDRGVCLVEGCIHVHAGVTARETVPIAA